MTEKRFLDAIQQSQTLHDALEGLLGDRILACDDEAYDATLSAQDPVYPREAVDDDAA